MAEQLSAAPPVVTDADVMVAFARGDEGAFVKLYDTYKLRIFNLTRRLLGDAARAEEATQDVFLKLYTARKSYNPTAKFSTFLYRIAVNHCLNAKAKKSERMVAPDPDLDAKHAAVSMTADTSLEQKALRAALHEALGKLPEQQRAALVLCHYEGSSYKEAADVLDVTEAAVKSLIHRARTRLVQELGAWLPVAARSSS